MIEDLNITITEEQLDSLKELCDCILDRNGSFIEIGGSTLGGFDGRVFSSECFIHDDLAIANAASIKFNIDSIRLAQEEAKRRDLRVIGTWHVHPPSFGVKFSSTDENFLFLERMLIRTDDPIAEAPKVHVILDIENQKIAAYSMRIGVNYGFEPIELDSQLAEEIETSDKQAMVLSGNQLLDYHPVSFKNGDLTGFYRRFDFPCISTDFEKIFLENYFQKTGSHEFDYVRVTESMESFRVKREEIELTTGFDDVGIGITK
jgi:hypothetical protein